MTTPSPLLSRPGAVEGGGADAGVASHYGEPLREQRALAAGTAVVHHPGVKLDPALDTQQEQLA